MWQFSDFRPSHSTQKVDPNFCFVVLCVLGGVKLAGYGQFKNFLKNFLAIRDQLIFGPHLGLFKWPQGDPTHLQITCQNN